LKIHLRPEASILEIGPRHERFIRFLAGHCRKLYIAVFIQNCLAYCRHFLGADSIDYVFTAGRSLNGIPDTSLDFVWS